MDGTRTVRLKTAGEFAASTLHSRSGLTVRVTDSGALFALRHGDTLINQLLPGPAEDGLFRLIVRWRSADGTSGWAPLVGSGIAHTQRGTQAMEWAASPRAGLTSVARLTLHSEKTAWAWHISLRNTTAAPIDADLVLAQDLGLGDIGTVRNSEAFTSQYIDLLPLEDPLLGWVVLARQNLQMGGGRHPWLASACAGGAAAFCTDGTQVFGVGHRLTGVPEAATAAFLESLRLQYESAFAGLQSRPLAVEPGSTSEMVFIARYMADHPAASSAADLVHLGEILPTAWATAGGPRATPEAPTASPDSAASPSLFVSSPWLHGDAPGEKEWSEWFPGARRHVESGDEGETHSFFSAAETHVVARGKEAGNARPHGHILRSGDWRWLDPEQFGTTCYAAGVFSAQAYMGNPSFARLLPVIRDALGVGRAAGQRVFVRRSGSWLQLGVPSAFAMTPSDARWIYKIGPETIEARVWCSRHRPAAFLELKAGPGLQPAEFLVTHTLALDANEFEHSGEIRVQAAQGWASCTPDPASIVGSRNPGACFAIAMAECSPEGAIGDDGPLYGDGRSRGVACIVLRSGTMGRFGVVLCGTLDGADALAQLVEAARLEWAGPSEAASPPPAPVRLAMGACGGAAPDVAATSAAVARIDEILPWFVHNAAIHFSAPHGLEQYGGAAWGVRDVCQGSVEWLLAAREWPLARRAIETVFRQQYAENGTWPQWFMHPPYRSIQQADSHGDVCFWPVKALCDYVEASNDLGILRSTAGYTDSKRFESSGPEDTLLQHCDRVVDHCESRFVPGTALVNYGDGDWDDTLQPADPVLRTRMVSSWTVGLAYHTFRQLAGVYRRIDEHGRQARLEGLLTRMRRDFADRLMPGSVVAGFLVMDPDGSARPLLHPEDTVTGIRYRLLPMTRAVLAELFTPEEAARHLGIVNRDLLYPDGVRLMSEPATYCGGVERLFKRAETAANVGREIGLQYVHAHLRYAEAMAKVGDADRLWTALQVANPVALRETVAHAAPRQSNVYFSSSDADFGDRLVAARRWHELRTGAVAVRGGWRLYSSGPGMFVHKVRTCLLGLRESFGDVVFDPVLPRSLDGLEARAFLCGRPVTLRYQVRGGTFAPRSISIDGVELKDRRREANPYREGGLCFDGAVLEPLLSSGRATILVCL